MHLATKFIIIVMPANMTANDCITAKKCKLFVLVSDNTLLTAGEHMPQQHDVSRDLERFMDSAEVGLDVFKDLVFASSLRLALQCATQFPCSKSFHSQLLRDLSDHECRKDDQLSQCS